MSTLFAVLETRTDGKIGLFKFHDKYDKKLRCPKTSGKYDNKYSLTLSFMFSKFFKKKISPQSQIDKLLNR